MNYRINLKTDPSPKNLENFGSKYINICKINGQITNIPIFMKVESSVNDIRAVIFEHMIAISLPNDSFSPLLFHEIYYTDLLVSFEFLFEMFLEGDVGFLFSYRDKGSLNLFKLFYVFDKKFERFLKLVTKIYIIKHYIKCCYGEIK